LSRLNLFRRFDPRLAAELRAQRRSIAKGVVCAAVTGALTALFIPLLREAVAALENAQGLDLWRIGQICLAVVGLFALKYAFTRGQVYYLSRAAARMSSDVRKRLYAKLLRLPVSYFSKRRAGAIQSILTNDVGVYQAAVTIVRDSIDGPIKAIGAFATVVYYQPILAGIVLLFMPVFVVVIQQNAKKMKRAQREVQEALSDLNAATQESLQGTRVVKAFGAEARMEGIYGALVERSFLKQMAATRRTAALRPLVELIGAVAIALVLFIAGLLASRGMLRVADIAAVIFALDVVNQGVRNLASVNNTYAQVQAAAERIYGEILDVPEEHVDSLGSRQLPSPQGTIEFRGVSFVYPDGTEALRDVSFTIPPGSSLALVGPSGAGKSTIADLLLRFYDPTQGRILFDGVDIRELDKDWLRGQIGVVPQQVFLFAGSVRDNIELGRPGASDEDVEGAARAAHADAFVERMPARYDAQLGEGGQGLSGGERQRVAIARALVRQPSVLLLDEATSALDATSEKVVTEALQEIMRTRTTLFIAHRLTTAARADNIVVLSRGEVVEQGSHAELMAANGAYAGLFRAFSGGVLEG
jgi:subfamily B ATP-binding cassette protein MsbA